MTGGSVVGHEHHTSNTRQFEGIVRVEEGVAASMGKQDWAIVVGVAAYPGLSNLDGPLNDATAFYKWVVDPAGGGVPRKQAIRVLTPAKKVPFRSVGVAKPQSGDILAALEMPMDAAEQSQMIGGEPRRLFLYFAGHGFSPPTSSDDAALLAANATRQRIYYILGRYFADWYFYSGYFDHVILFMDCCRDIYNPPYLNKPWEDRYEGETEDRRAFYGFGAKFSALARENTARDGKVRGVFSQALLAGLRGGAYDLQAKDGRITAKSLFEYLKNSMAEFLTEDAKDRKDVPAKPDIDCKPEHLLDPEFVIARITPPTSKVGRLARRLHGVSKAALVPAAPLTYTVHIHFSAGSSGSRADIKGATFEPIASTTMTEERTWTLPLPRGRYFVELPDAQQEKPFDVLGTGEVNVDL